MRRKIYIVFFISVLISCSLAAQFPTINNATYNALTGELTLAGQDLNIGANAIDVSKITISNGVDLYTLTSLGNSKSNVSSTTSAVINIGGYDRAFVNKVLNSNGTTAISTIAYTIIAQSFWNGNIASDLVLNPITVFNFQKPTITEILYNASTGVFTVKGFGFVADFFGNDVDISKFSFVGQGGVLSALSTTPMVEVDSVSRFRIALSFADKSNINLLLNKNGYNAWDSSPFKYYAAEDWNSAAAPALPIADISGNTVLVSGVISPDISSADYNFITGQLTISGNNFQTIAGALNDIDVTKITISNGVKTYQLTSSTNSVDISGTNQVTLSISGIDKTRINGILNKSGITSDIGSAFNLAVQSNWNGFGESDLFSNSINVANFTNSQISDVTYDASTGVMGFTGNYLVSSGFSNDDIDITKINIIGSGGGSYTLTSSGDIDIVNETSFGITITGTDRTQIDNLLNRNGTKDWNNSFYQANFLDDWCVGAPGSYNIADNNNGITVSGVQSPVLTSASYNSSNGALTIVGSNLQEVAGSDRLASKITIKVGSQSYPLTGGTADVEITNNTTATLVLSALDRVRINYVLNKNGSTSIIGDMYQLQVEEGWNGLSEKDYSGKPLTVSSYSLPVVTSVTYIANTGELTFNGTGFASYLTSISDINSSAISVFGGNSSSYTLLVNYDIKIINPNEVKITLSGSDKTNVNALYNRNGTKSFSEINYSLTLSDDWNAPVTWGNTSSVENNVTVSGILSPEVTSASYDFASGQLSVTGLNFQAISGVANDIDVTKIIISNGAVSYRLTSSATSSVDISGNNLVTLAISGLDKTWINGILNKSGFSSESGTSFNLAVETGWNSLGEPDLSGNPIFVVGYSYPQIIGTTYNVSTGVLAITGNYLVSSGLSSDDIDVSKINIVGSGGGNYTLTTTANVDILNETSINIILNGTDRTQVNTLLNRNGTKDWGNNLYQANFFDNWCSGVPGNYDISDNNNGITVSGIPAPTLSSSSYNSSAGTLTITGTNFSSIIGSDILAAKITIKVGGQSYPLTGGTPDAEISNSTSATLVLSSLDKVKINSLLNKNGTSSENGDIYQIQVEEGWNGLSEKDYTGKPVVVTNYSLPLVSSVTYNATSAELTFSGTGFTSYLTSVSDINSGAITLFGGNSSNYTLLGNYNIKIVSPIEVKVLLSGSDKTNVNALFNRNGSVSFSGVSYTITLLDDWNTPVSWGNTANTINTVVVSGVVSAEVTSANYDFATGNLEITGINLIPSAGNDIDNTKITISNGLKSFTLTTETPGVDIQNSTSVKIVLSGKDRASVNYVLDKNGIAAINGGTYNLIAQTGWNGLGEADILNNPITVSNHAVPEISTVAYNAATGTFNITGKNFVSDALPINDIDVSKIKVGQGVTVAYTIIATPSIEVLSDNSFSLVLNASDKTQVNSLLNRNGTFSFNDSVYNFAALEDWNALAAGSLVIADLKNGIVVSGVPNYAPQALSVFASGDTVNSKTLTSHYTYLDLDGDSPGTPIINWYSYTNALGAGKTLLASSIEFLIRPSDIGKFINFEITPIALAGTTPGVTVASRIMGPIQNAKPTVSNVRISGNQIVCSTLTGLYDYSDIEGDLQGVSIFKWYRANTETGAKTLIAGANSKDYKLVKADKDKYIFFEVTPRALTGTLTGSPVFSEPTGIIADKFPTVTFFGGTSICKGTIAELNLFFTGTPPFNLTFTDGTKDSTIQSINKTYSLFVSKAGTYKGKLLTDTYNCPVDSLPSTTTVTVIPLPVVEITGLNAAYNINNDPVPLIGSPTGGIFTGPGVLSFSNSFSPAFAGTLNSPHSIIYTYQSPQGCKNSDTAKVEVIDAVASVTGFRANSKYCNFDSAFTITGTNKVNSIGVFAISGGVGLTDNQNNSASIRPGIMNSGIYTVSYTYVDGIPLTIYREITIERLEEARIFGLNEAKYCKNISPIELSGNYSEGIFTGSAIDKNTTTNKYFFDPSKANSGATSVSYTYTTSYGCVLSKTLEKTISPVANVDFKITNGCYTGDSTEFKNLTVFADPIIKWDWRFGDLQASELDNRSSIFEPKHKYPSIGNRTVRLTAENIFGCSDTEEKIIHIGDIPDANFIWGTECYEQAIPVVFSNTSSSVDELSQFYWDVQDTSSQNYSYTTKEMSHTFPILRNYLVKLKVSTEFGCSDSISKIINLRPIIDLKDTSYANNFEIDKGFWLASDTTSLNKWTFGKPDGLKISSAFSGNNAYFTSLKDSRKNQQLIITSPCFDFTGTSRPYISLATNSNAMVGQEGAVLQFSTDQEASWENVGAIGSGSFWFNDYAIQSQPGLQQIGWSGTNTSWVTSKHNLDSLRNKSRVRFRIIFGETSKTTGTDGFAFDDVFIGTRTKNLLVEQFTNNSQSTSIEANAFLDDVIKKLSNDAIAIQYHASFPGIDTFNMHNPSDPGARILYYGIGTTPVALLAGGIESKYVYDFTAKKPNEEDIKVLALQESKFDMKLKVKKEVGKISGTLDIKALKDLPNKGLSAQLVVVEDILSQVSGQQVAFYNVVKKMLPTAAGTSIHTAWTTGKTESVNFSWNYSNVYNSKNLHIVAFLQDEISHEIYQVVSDDSSDIVLGLENDVKDKYPLTHLNVMVYPNPASDRALIVFREFDSSELSLELLTWNGKVVAKDKILKGVNQYELNTSGLSNGVYLIRLSNSLNQYFTTKLVVLH